MRKSRLLSRTAGARNSIYLPRETRGIWVGGCPPRAAVAVAERTAWQPPRQRASNGETRRNAPKCTRPPHPVTPGSGVSFACCGDCINNGDELGVPMLLRVRRRRCDTPLHRREARNPCLESHAPHRLSPPVASPVAMDEPPSTQPPLPRPSFRRPAPFRRLLQATRAPMEFQISRPRSPSCGSGGSSGGPGWGPSSSLPARGGATRRPGRVDGVRSAARSRRTASRRDEEATAVSTVAAGPCSRPGRAHRGRPVVA